MGSLLVEDLCKTFAGRRTTTAAIDHVTVRVEDGELLVLLGPSGCGKTTTLRSLAGLEAPDAGRISFDDRVVFSAESGVDVPPNRRDIGMVFQSFALWPHMTVRKNIEYPLRARNQRDGLKHGWVEAAAELVDVAALLDRYPSQLSGGQQQRVSLARALVARPGLVLFDEPLSNLDARLREQLRTDLHQLHRQLGFTGVYVTHDQAEALALGDRLAIMKAGKIEQLDTPEGVFGTPLTEYVAEFIGIDNALQLERSDGRWGTDAGLLVGRVPGYTDDRVRLRVRTEDVRLVEPSSGLAGDEFGVEGATVVDVTYGGRTRSVTLQLRNAQRISATVPVTAEAPKPGQSVTAAFRASSAVAYGRDGHLARASDRA